MNEAIRKTTIGGQALIEGIYMRGPGKSCIVVRKTDGELVVEERPQSKKLNNAFFKLPFVRGVISLVASMKEGISALNFSASFFEDEEVAEEEKGRFEKWLEKRVGAERLESLLMTFALVIGCVTPVLLFILLPTLLAGFFDQTLGTGIARNLAEGLIRIVIFLLFLFAVSWQKDIHRTFMYHGAEHKTIFCYEKGLPLTVENTRAQTRFHPRCGTSFLFNVMIISILVYSLFSWNNVWMRMLLRILMLPVVVGISYEINRFAGRHDNWFTNLLRAPGLALQRLTTAEPDDSMLEVAIKAIEKVIPEDGSDRW